MPKQKELVETYGVVQFSIDEYDDYPVDPALRALMRGNPREIRNYQKAGALPILSSVLYRSHRGSNCFKVNSAPGC